MRKKTIYLAGSMEAISDEDAKKWRKEVKKYYIDNSLDFECINPLDYYSYRESYHTNDFEVFRFDIQKIKTSDLVLVNLDHIRNSVGTCDEIMYAYLNDIPVIGFLETENILPENAIIKTVHPWKYLQINRIETGKNAMQKACEYIENYY